MLYSINTIILDTRTNQLVEGAVVIDLYVNSEDEANCNLFARDVMNLPVIKSAYRDTMKPVIYLLAVLGNHILLKYTIPSTTSYVSIRKTTNKHFRE